MPPKTKKLYKVDPKKMAFGVVPGSHIPHMFDKKPEQIKGFVELKQGMMPQIKSGYDTVGQEELFHNYSEFATERTFRNLAEQSENDYTLYQNSDPEMVKFLYGVKDYITAEGRTSQQKALISLKIRMYNCNQKYDEQLREYSKKETLTPVEQEQKRELEWKKQKLRSYAEPLIRRTRGFLEIPEEQKVSPAELTEPEGVFVGKIAHWENSNDALFPHDPSPNDIKQGVGLQDCFALSVLTQLADTNPDYIKNMMRDNGNGTVSVRFYNTIPGKDPKKDQPVKEPVIITVKKSTAKLPTGHDVYASSSLWVQMMEKAYAKYAEQYGIANDNGQPGMGRIWRNESLFFMNAILPTEHGAEFLPGMLETKLYDKNKNGEFINHPDYYLKDEEAVYNGLKKYVNDKREIVTAMPDKRFLTLNESPHDEGLRNGHIYTIRKVFEKDGKKFVQLRDPYASFNPKYDGTNLTYSKMDILKGTINAGLDTMGTFNLELKDFMRHFNQFSGMSKEAAEEFSEITKNARVYAQSPVTKAEMHSGEQLEIDVQETEKEFALVDSARTRNRAATAKKIIDDPASMERLSKQMKDVTRDLKSTDEMFILTNSRQFNAMRDTLYAFNKDLQKHLSGEKKLGAEELAAKLNALENTTKEYMRTKENSMNRDMGKGKKVSDRAFLRYTAALNLNCIANFEEPLCAWPTKRSETLHVLKADIETKLDRADASLLKNEGGAQQAYAKRMLEKVNGMLEQNRNVKEGARQNLREVGKPPAKPKVL